MQLFKPASLVLLLLPVIIISFGQHASAKKDPNDYAKDLIVKYLKQYAGADDYDRDGIDLTGNSDWYMKTFAQFAPVQTSYALTPPSIDVYTQSREELTPGVTLLCPSAELPYTCQLDQGIVRGSAAATTRTSTWNVGTSVKESLSAGVGFLGNNGKAGAFFAFSYSYTESTSTTRVTTEQYTTTGRQSAVINPSEKQCAWLGSAFTKLTQSGRQTLVMKFQGYVGLNDEELDTDSTWKDDGTISAGQGIRKKCDKKASCSGDIIHLRDMAYMVKVALENGWSQAEGWSVSADGTTAMLSVRYMDIDFYAASEGEAFRTWVPADSVECRGPADYSPTMLAASSDLAGNNVGGNVPRRLRQTSSNQASGALHVRMLKEPSPPSSVAFSNSGAVGSRHWGSNHVQAAVANGYMQPAFCGVAVDLGNDGRANFSLVPVQTSICKEIGPTDPQELAADTLTAATEVSAAAAPAAVLQYEDKIKKLVQAVCVQQSGVTCDDFDLRGDKEWYEDLWDDDVWKPVLEYEDDIWAGAEGYVPTPAPAKTAVMTEYHCPYDHTAPYICESSIKSSQTQAKTKATTTTQNFQYKAGFSIKAEVSIGVAAEWSHESSFDWGHSFSDGSSTTETNGIETSSAIKVQVDPDLDSCVILNVTVYKAAGVGASRATLCTSPFAMVGTATDNNHNWKSFDLPGEEHKYRHHTLTSYVYLARKYQLETGDYRDWYIDEYGRACVYNVVTLSTEVGYVSSVSPIMFPKSSPECESRKNVLGFRPPKVGQPRACNAAGGKPCPLAKFRARAIPGRINMVKKCGKDTNC